MNSQLLIRGFDFHCHVDLHPDPPELIRACEENAILTLAVTTTPKAWNQNVEWSKGSHYVYPAVGLHPELVSDRFAEIELLESAIARTPLVGEIGLDGSPQHRGSWRQQADVFARSLAAAQNVGGRVASIHSRQAAEEVVQHLREQTTGDRVLPILHWFSGSQSQARQAADLGAYFSVNPRSLEHARGVALARSLPEARLLTETDSPFASLANPPTGPKCIPQAVQRLASIRDVSAEAMATCLHQNARRVLAFAGIHVAAR